MAYDVQQAVRDACLWLPETDEYLSHGSPNFRVRGKTDVHDHCDAREVAALASQSYRHFALKRMLQMLPVDRDA